MDLSKNIRELRESLKIKQIEIADMLGMERSNYARLEMRGEKMSVEQLTSIAKAMGVSIIDIINYPNEVILEDKKTLIKRKLTLDYVRRMCNSGAELLNIIQKLMQDESVQVYKKINTKYQQVLQERFDRDLQKIHVDEQTRQSLEETRTKDLNKALLEMSMLLHDAGEEISKMKDTPH